MHDINNRSIISGRPVRSRDTVASCVCVWTIDELRRSDTRPSEHRARQVDRAVCPRASQRLFGLRLQLDVAHFAEPEPFDSRSAINVHAESETDSAEETSTEEMNSCSDHGRPGKCIAPGESKARQILVEAIATAPSKGRAPGDESFAMLVRACVCVSP